MAEIKLEQQSRSQILSNMDCYPSFFVFVSDHVISNLDSYDNYTVLPNSQL